MKTFFFLFPLIFDFWPLEIVPPFIYLRNFPYLHEGTQAGAWSSIFCVPANSPSKTSSGTHFNSQHSQIITSWFTLSENLDDLQLEGWGDFRGCYRMKKNRLGKYLFKFPSKRAIIIKVFIVIVRAITTLAIGCDAKTFSCARCAFC